MACYGCGLRINGVDDSLEVATAEEFGSGVLAGFGSDSTVGSPVYCDANGQLRTAPEHTSDTFEASGSQGSTAIADGAAVSGATTSIVVNNPSTLRASSIFGSCGVIEQLDWNNGNTTFNPSLTMTRNGLGFFLLSGTVRIEGDSALPSQTWWQTEGSFVDSLAAGGSVTYAVSCAIDAAALTSGNFVSGVSARGLVVTQ